MSSHPFTAIAVTPIEKGGSGRKFWRMQVGPQSLILVRYNEDRPENKHYVAIGHFLAGVGVRVPATHFHDEAEGLIVMEDAGDTDLWSHRLESWPQRRATTLTARAAPPPGRTRRERPRRITPPNSSAIRHLR